MNMEEETTIKLMQAVAGSWESEDAWIVIDNAGKVQNFPYVKMSMWTPLLNLFSNYMGDIIDIYTEKGMQTREFMENDRKKLLSIFQLIQKILSTIDNDVVNPSQHLIYFPYVFDLDVALEAILTVDAYLIAAYGTGDRYGPKIFEESDIDPLYFYTLSRTFREVLNTDPRSGDQIDILYMNKEMIRSTKLDISIYEVRARDMTHASVYKMRKYIQKLRVEYYTRHDPENLLILKFVGFSCINRRNLYTPKFYEYFIGKELPQMLELLGDSNASHKLKTYILHVFSSLADVMYPDRSILERLKVNEKDSVFNLFLKASLQDDISGAFVKQLLRFTSSCFRTEITLHEVIAEKVVHYVLEGLGNPSMSPDVKVSFLRGWYESYGWNTYRPFEIAVQNGGMVIIMDQIELVLKHKEEHQKYLEWLFVTLQHLVNNIPEEESAFCEYSSRVYDLTFAVLSNSHEYNPDIIYRIILLACDYVNENDRVFLSKILERSLLECLLEILEMPQKNNRVSSYVFYFIEILLHHRDFNISFAKSRFFKKAFQAMIKKRFSCESGEDAVYQDISVDGYGDNSEEPQSYNDLILFGIRDAVNSVVEKTIQYTPEDIFSMPNEEGLSKSFSMWQEGVESIQWVFGQATSLPSEMLCKILSLGFIRKLAYILFNHDYSYNCSFSEANPISLFLNRAVFGSELMDQFIVIFCTGLSEAICRFEDLHDLECIMDSIFRCKKDESRVELMSNVALLHRYIVFVIEAINPEKYGHNQWFFCLVSKLERMLGVICDAFMNLNHAYLKYSYDFFLLELNPCSWKKPNNNSTYRKILDSSPEHFGYLFTRLYSTFMNFLAWIMQSRNTLNTLRGYSDRGSEEFILNRLRGEFRDGLGDERFDFMNTYYILPLLEAILSHGLVNSYELFWSFRFDITGVKVIEKMLSQSSRKNIKHDLSLEQGRESNHDGIIYKSLGIEEQEEVTLVPKDGTFIAEKRYITAIFKLYGEILAKYGADDVKYDTLKSNATLLLRFSHKYHLSEEMGEIILKLLKYFNLAKSRKSGHETYQEFLRIGDYGPLSEYNTIVLNLYIKFGLKSCIELISGKKEIYRQIYSLMRFELFHDLQRETVFGFYFIRDKVSNLVELLIQTNSGVEAGNSESTQKHMEIIELLINNILISTLLGEAGTSNDSNSSSSGVPQYERETLTKIFSVLNSHISEESLDCMLRFYITALKLVETGGISLSKGDIFEIFPFEAVISSISSSPERKHLMQLFSCFVRYFLEDEEYLRVAMSKEFVLDENPLEWTKIKPLMNSWMPLAFRNLKVFLKAITDSDAPGSQKNENIGSLQTRITKRFMKMIYMNGISSIMLLKILTEIIVSFPDLSCLFEDREWLHSLLYKIIRHKVVMHQNESIIKNEAWHRSYWGQCLVNSVFVRTGNRSLKEMVIEIMGEGIRNGDSHTLYSFLSLLHMINTSSLKVKDYIGNFDFAEQDIFFRRTKEKQGHKGQCKGKTVYLPISEDMKEKLFDAILSRMGNINPQSSNTQAIFHIISVILGSLLTIYKKDGTEENNDLFKSASENDKVDIRKVAGINYREAREMTTSIFYCEEASESEDLCDDVPVEDYFGGTFNPMLCMLRIFHPLRMAVDSPSQENTTPEDFLKQLLIYPETYGWIFEFRVLGKSMELWEMIRYSVYKALAGRTLWSEGIARRICTPGLANAQSDGNPICFNKDLQTKDDYFYGLDFVKNVPSDSDTSISKWQDYNLQPSPDIEETCFDSTRGFDYIQPSSEETSVSSSHLMNQKGIEERMLYQSNYIEFLNEEKEYSRLCYIKKIKNMQRVSLRSIDTSSLVRIMQIVYCENLINGDAIFEPLSMLSSSSKARNTIIEYSLEILRCNIFERHGVCEKEKNFLIKRSLETLAVLSKKNEEYFVDICKDPRKINILLECLAMEKYSIELLEIIRRIFYAAREHNIVFRPEQVKSKILIDFILLSIDRNMSSISMEITELLPDGLMEAPLVEFMGQFLDKCRSFDEEYENPEPWDDLQKTLHARAKLLSKLSVANPTDHARHEYYRILDEIQNSVIWKRFYTFLGKERGRRFVLSFKPMFEVFFWIRRLRLETGLSKGAEEQERQGVMYDHCIHETESFLCLNADMNDEAKHSTKKSLYTGDNPENGQRTEDMQPEKCSCHGNSGFNTFFMSTVKEYGEYFNLIIETSEELESGDPLIHLYFMDVLNFENRKKILLHGFHYGDDSTRFDIIVNRSSVFEDSYCLVMSIDPKAFRARSLNIKFIGEEGFDRGGLTKEWFTILSREMIKSEHRLFTATLCRDLSYYIDRNTICDHKHLDLFRFIGRIMAKAIVEEAHLDLYLARPIYKQLLKRKCDMSDLEFYDLGLYNSFIWMANNSIEGILDLTFTTQILRDGNEITVNLVENGSSVIVTDANKAQYIKSLIKYKLTAGLHKQMAALQTGFYEVLDYDLMKVFDEKEIELLICGLPHIDIDDWERNTEYSGYTEDSDVIQWFWKAVKSFNDEERAKLLQFVTGTSRVPSEGFSRLRAGDWVQRFQIHRIYGDNERLPSSHTCVNHLNLPEYGSYQVLFDKLLKAITEGGGTFEFK